VLAFFASLVPTLTSLAAAAWFLVDQSRYAHEHRVRSRVESGIDEHMRRDSQDRQEVLSRIGLPDAKDRQRDADERGRYRAMLLRANGVTTRATKHVEHQVNVTMSGPVLTRAELVRQWLVLGGAVAGVLLLALSLSEA